VGGYYEVTIASAIEIEIAIEIGLLRIPCSWFAQQADFDFDFDFDLDFDLDFSRVLTHRS
jgi:hypothetical protein